MKLGGGKWLGLGRAGGRAKGESSLAQRNLQIGPLSQKRKRLEERRQFFLKVFKETLWAGEVAQIVYPGFSPKHCKPGIPAAEKP